MTIDTGIEWTDSTWNPVRGCTRVSEGCKNCYAELLAARFSDPGLWGHGLAKRFKRPDGGMEGRWTGRIEMADDKKLTWPIRFKGHPSAIAEGRPSRIFVNSTSDLFHEALPVDDIVQVLAVMALSPQHIYQVLTKRAARMREIMATPHMGEIVWRAADAIARRLNLPASHPSTDYLMAGPLGAPWPLANLWLGVSTEDQATFDERWPELEVTPAAIRFFSFEPLLGAIDPTAALMTGLFHWGIAGGESGPRARPAHPHWVRLIRDVFATFGVAFYFKQWGAYRPTSWDEDGQIPDREPEFSMAVNGALDRMRPFTLPDSGGPRPRWIPMSLFSKHDAGALFEGIEHKAFPDLARAA